MGNNQLAIIEPDTFHVLVELQVIDLNYNQLTKIEPQTTFYGLILLQYLYLNNNQITEIKKDIFQNLFQINLYQFTV
jgi:Leucine-rich repeat (LRR) protein